MKIIKIIFVLNILFSQILYCKPLVSPDSLPSAKTGWRYNSRIFSVGLGNQNTDLERTADLNAASNYTISSIKSSNPLYVKFEFYVSKRFGIGASLNYNKMTYDYSYTTSNGNQPTVKKSLADYNVFATNLRINYHFLHQKKIDFYVGAGTGLRIVGSRNHVTSMKELSGGFAKEGELTAGLRYLMDGIFGIYLEAGLTRSIVQGGLSLNLSKLH